MKTWLGGGAVVFAWLVLAGCAPTRAEQPGAQAAEVQSIGSIRRVMQEGDARRRVALSELPREHLYAVGPIENFGGEITVIDGEPYVARVGAAAEISITRSWEVGAPFLAYSNVRDWIERPLPDTVRDLKDLESHLETLAERDASGNPIPFPFQLKGVPKRVEFHVLRPVAGDAPGESRSRHQQARTPFQQQDTPATLVGFFSRSHEGVFTHRGEFVHVHIVDREVRNSGHVDRLELGPDSRIILSLPKHLAR